MNKLIKKIIFSIACSTLSIATSLSIALPLSKGTTDKTNIVNTSVVNQSTESSEIIPTESNDQNANLSTTNGPVTFLGNTITALDWYGNKLWSLDLSTKIEDKNGKTSANGSTTDYTDGSWKRAWFNWDYNRTTNLIWVLGFWSITTKTQPLLGIDASTGTIKYEQKINYSSYASQLGINVSANTVYRFISALSSGKVMVYGGAGTTYNAKSLLYDPTSKSISLVSGNSANTNVLPMNDTSYGTNYKWYFFNLVPIGDNKNLVEVVNYANSSNLTGDAGNGLANYNTYFLLVDDSLNMLVTDSSNKWTNHVQVASGMQGYRNTQITPQRDYYTMLDGRVVTVVYNTAIVIDGTTSNVKIGTYPMSEQKWIKSWAFDSNQNLYFKFKNEAKIYKVSGTVWSSLNSESSSSTVTPSTYLDLSGFSEIKTYANNFIIYNVYGYTGQLMLLNSVSSEYINTDNEKYNTDNSTTNYGLAVAITQNATNQDQGDYKGMLNGPNSIQKASDFEINSSILGSKIPSEITKSDITTLNNSFFKDGDSDGFKIVSMDDTTGDITIECKLYQIPWFASALPSGISPRVVQHTYKTTNNITNKVSWKNLSISTDYDFLNMKPSTITNQDAQNLDPFQVSFQSQTITDSSGNVLYPQKTYTVSDANDTNGTIKVKVTYKYIPMGVTYSGNDSVVKTYTSEKTYDVFKSGTTPSFKFIGQSSSSSTTVDATSVAQLKFFLTANTLPSSFESLNSSTDSANSEFLKFINTDTSKGYPISKMKFNVTADDEKGTLTVKATMPSSYSPLSKEETFSVTYTNLNKISAYTFSFKKDATAIGTSNFSSMLPSAATDGDIINNLISYSGFSANDFSISKTANDEKGTLTVSVNLDSDYANKIGNGNVGFTKYVATYTFSGFMTTSQYNQRFDVEFVSDSDQKLLTLKQMQVSEIYSALVTNKTSIKVGDTTYTSLKELIEKLLVSKLGSLVPTNWASQNSITADMYIDNSQGIASFYVNIPKDLMNGANSDLNLVVSYTGFVKGNVDQTNDNLSFVSSNMLENYLLNGLSVSETEFKAFTPTTFAEWLTKNNNENALKLITYKSGQYIDLITNSKYTLTVVPNSTQRTVDIYIHFDGVTNASSLSEYSVTYTI